MSLPVMRFRLEIWWLVESCAVLFRNNFQFNFAYKYSA